MTRNGDWFSKFPFLDVLGLTSKITMQRMLERDDFTKRVKKRPRRFICTNASIR